MDEGPMTLSEARALEQSLRANFEPCDVDWAYRQAYMDRTQLAAFAGEHIPTCPLCAYMSHLHEAERSRLVFYRRDAARLKSEEHGPDGPPTPPAMTRLPY